MKHILIADPNANSRLALSLLISRRLGMLDIGQAGDVETLICTLADCPPDILLLDWQLYGAPAPETCRLLRKAYPELKVVLLSLNTEDVQPAQNAGAIFLYKGALPDQVINILRPLLGNDNPKRGESS